MTMAHLPFPRTSRTAGSPDRRNGGTAGGPSPPPSPSALSSSSSTAPGAPGRGQHYFFHGPAGQNYLSPFYSPLFYDTPTPSFTAKTHSFHAWSTGARPAGGPPSSPSSPPCSSSGLPAGFRFTCYGFRGHYYKGLWATPQLRRRRARLPRQRLPRRNASGPCSSRTHRYFLYVIILLLLVKFYDTYEMLWFFDNPKTPDPAHRHFGLGLGSLVLAAEPILLTLYVGGCHSSATSSPAARMSSAPASTASVTTASPA